MRSALCPDEQTLQQMLLGHLVGDDAAELEDHLSTCESCAETAARLADSDALIEAVKAAGGWEDDSAASELVARIKAMGADSVHTHLDETHDRLPSSQDLTQFLPEDEVRPAGELSFLDPPQADGELGRLGRFRVLEVLGRGGMGVVLRAKDPKLRRLVAIKVLNLKTLDKSDAVARFLREAQATAAIDHDNIVTIHDVGEQRGMPYYAMQFLRGEALSDRLRRDKKLPIADAVRIAREIAQGLSAAHAQGLLHRDIKPANVWLEEGNVRAKIVDFGLARIDDHEDSELTNSGAILGTPKYMSPEQAQGQPVDHRCDLFSLGSVLYHLVTGQAPFSGTNVTATLIAVASGEYEDIQDLVPDCPESLKTIVNRLLEKSPDDRYATAEDVVTALRALEDELLATPPLLVEQPAAQPTSAGRNRKPVVLIALAAALPLLIALAVVFLWRTPSGTLRVEVNDPDIEVFIDDDKLNLTDRRFHGTKKVGKRRLRIKVGDQWIRLGPEAVFTLNGEEKNCLSVQLNDVQLSSNQFEITRERETVLSIALIPVHDEPADEGGPHIQQPRTNMALSFDGKNDGVVLPLKLGNEGPFTLEAWVTPQAVEGQGHVLGSGYVLLRSNDRTDRHWVATLHYGKNVENWSRSSITTAQQYHDGQRVHLAGVYAGGDVRIFVNGQPGGKSFSYDKKWLTGEDESEFTTRLGAVQGDHHFKGLIDEIRISSTVRYAEAFTPAERFEPDQHTLALYHCDEGSGQTLFDSSKNQHHGTVLGPTWVPALSPKSATQDSIDLLALFDPQADAISGEWSIANGKLSCKPAWGAKARLPASIEGGYELELDVTHSSGISGLMLTLPVGEHAVVFMPACSVNRLGVISGFSNIGGAGAKSNGTARTEESTIGRRYQLTVRVEPDETDARITIWKDGELFREWKGREDALSDGTVWNMPERNQLGVGATSCDLTVHSAELRMLSGQTRSLRPAASEATAKTIDADDGWVDLLSIIDVEADSEEGGWQRDERGIVRVEDDASTLRVPVEIHGNYEVRMKFLRDDDEESGQGLILPIGPPPTTVHPQFFAFGEYHGLSTIRGKRITYSSNPTKRKLARKAGQQYEALLRVVVNDEAVEITCHLDREAFYTFKGLKKDLADTLPEWLHHSIALRSGAVPGARWTSLELRMLDGHAKLQRPQFKPTPTTEHPRLELVRKTEANVVDPIYSHDGVHILAVGWGDGRFEVRDAKTGEVVRASKATGLVAEERGRKSVPTTIAISPNASLVAAGNNQGAIVVWDYQADEFLLQSETQLGTNHSLRFSPDGKRLLAVHDDGAILSWQLGGGDTWKSIRKFGRGGGKIAFSPDGNSLAFAERTSVYLLDSNTGETIWERPVPRGTPHHCEFTFDGSRLAVFGLSASAKPIVRLLDTVSSEVVNELTLPGAGHVRNAKFVGGDRYAFVCRHEETVSLVDLRTAEVVQSIAGPGTGDVSPDRRFAFTKGPKYEAALWRLYGGQDSRAVKPLTANDHIVGVRLSSVVGEASANITAVALSPDGKLAAVGLEGGEFEWWDLSSNERLAIQKLKRPLDVRHLQFTADGMRLFVKTVPQDHYTIWNFAASAWDVATRKQIGDAHNVRHFALSPDGRYILGSNDAGGVGYHKTDFSERISQIPEPFLGKKFRVFAFLPHGHAVAISPTHLSVIDPEQFDGLIQQIELPPPTGEGDEICDLAPTHDGKAIVYCREKSGFYWVDLESKKTHRCRPSGATGVCNIPHRQPTDNSILAEQGGELICIPGYQQEPYALKVDRFERFDLSEDRRFVLTGQGSSLKLWDLQYGPTSTRNQAATNADSPGSAEIPFDEDDALQLQQAWADYLDVPVEKEVELRGGEAMTMVLIPPGKFSMRPDYHVDLSQPYYVSKYETTVGQYQQFVSQTDDPYSLKEKPANHPAEPMSWNDARRFCQWLSKTQGATYRLPTEAEWEWATRAGTSEDLFFTATGGKLNDYSWSSANSDGQVHPVGSLAANPWGLHDIYGNVTEWVADWHAPFPRGTFVDPTGPETGKSFVVRGGDAGGPANHCSQRPGGGYLGTPDFRRDFWGFRVVEEIDVKRLTEKPSYDKVSVERMGFALTGRAILMPKQAYHYAQFDIERTTASGDIHFEWMDLPPGVISRPSVLRTGHDSFTPRLYALGNAPSGTHKVALVATVGEQSTEVPITIEIQDAEVVKPLHIPTGGLGGTDVLVPTTQVEQWKREGVFAEIKGPGTLRFPRLPVDKFVVDIEMEVRNPTSQLTIAHSAPSGRWRSVVEVAHVQGKDGGVRVATIRRRGGKHFRPVPFSAPLGKRFVLSIAAKGTGLGFYTNFYSRRYQTNAQPELHLTLSATSEDADLTIFSMRYRPLTVAGKTKPDAIPSNEETDYYGLYLGDDWPKPAGSPAYESLATGKWERIELTDAMLQTWERQSEGKLITKRLSGADVELSGDHQLIFSGYDARNTIFRVQFEPKWSDNHDFVAVGVRYKNGSSCEVVLEADSEFRLNTGPRYYLTHRTFNERHRGPCELTIAAIDNRLWTYVNGQMVLTSTKTAMRSGPPYLDLNASVVLKRIDVMVLSHAPTSVADPNAWPKPTSTPDYAPVATGRWQPVELTDELIAQWEALNPKLIRISRLDDGGIRILGPHTPIFDLPGYESRNILVRARLQSRFRNGHSFFALRARRSNRTGYAVSLHPKYQLRTGYDFPRWHQESNIDFAPPMLEPVELVMATIGPWVRGYVNGRETTTLTNWHFDAGSIALQTRRCVDLLSLEVMHLDDEKTREEIRQRLAELETPADDSSNIEGDDPDKTPPTRWPRAKAEPDYANIATGTWRPVELTKALRRSWEKDNEENHFTVTASDDLEFIGHGKCALPEELNGRDVLLRAELTQLWGDPVEWVMLGLRSQDDHSYIGSHLNCGMHVNSGTFPRGHWRLEKQVSYSETYDGRIELAVAAIDERVITFVNGKQVTSFAADIETAGGLLLRHDGPFVLHKLDYMNLDELGEQ